MSNFEVANQQGRRILYRLVVYISVILFWLSAGESAFALDSHKPLNQYTHLVWQTENGLPQNTVHQVIQTREGFIWLATDGGLVRFDGVNFVTFNTESTPAIKSNQIRSLTEDADGYLWVCTPAGLVRLRDGVFTSFTTKDGLSSDAVWRVMQDRSGTIWIATSAGLNSYKDGKFVSFGQSDGLAGGSVEAMLEDQGGTLWIGSSDGLTSFKDGAFKKLASADRSITSIRALATGPSGVLWIGTSVGLFSLNGGRVSAYTTQNGMSSDGVESLLEDREGRVWVGTLNGLNLLDKGTITTFTTKNGLPGNGVSSVERDREGAIWVCTDSGLARFENGTFTSFAAKDSLSGLTVLSLYEDREGDLWLGTDSGGLHVLKDNKFVTYTTDDGLSNNLIRAVFQDRESNIWIGTSGGGLNLLKNGQVTTYTTNDGLCSNVVLAVYGDREGNLWVGTPNGLNRLQNGHFTTYTSSDGLADDFVRSIYEDRSGDIWIGTRRGLTEFKNGKFTSFTTLDGLANDYIGALVEDRDGFLWIGTLGGLSRYSDGSFASFTAKDGLSSNVVTALYEDHNGALWVGTNGGGLNRYRDGKFTGFTTRNGLFDDVIYDILEDDSGNLWLGCNKGVFRVSLKDMDDFAAGRSSYINTVSYGTADGMKTSECSGGGHPTGWKAQDGKLWFSTLKGVAVIDPERISLNKLPPPVVIEQFAADDAVIREPGKLEVSPGPTRFAFHYAGLSFVAPEKVRYKYKLEGFDRDWVSAGTRRVAYYTNLPPGSYTFRVMACNNDGVWNEAGATFSFRLKPHFYQTYWFYGLCVVAFGLFAWQLYLTRVRVIRSQFSAVLAERNRIAREIHDTLTQSLAGISLQLELTAKKLSSSVDSAKTHLNQARMLTRESLDDARRSIWDLRSQSLEQEDLPTNLSRAAKQLTANTSVRTQLLVSGTYRPLDKSVEGNLLRICQEAINNALKHATPQKIDITLAFDSKVTSLSVRDDGSGFESEKPPPVAEGHFGLLGMRERAEQIGGKLTVRSAPGAGTEVLVELPLVG